MNRITARDRALEMAGMVWIAIGSLVGSLGVLYIIYLEAGNIVFVIPAVAVGFYGTYRYFLRKYTKGTR
jgi:hypothetical protein